MPVVVTLPGSPEPFTVGKILCIGRNYAAHAAEMKSDVPTSPMVFLKPPSSVVRNGGEVVLPRQSSDVHHEVEVVVLIGKGGKDIAESEALGHVAGYAVGLDMTARDIQAVAKSKGHPWTVAKGFDSFAPLGDFVTASEVGDPQSLGIRLRVNGSVRQEGSTSEMIFPVARLVSWCSGVMSLERGDLIYTGTPEGVAAVVAGDVLEATADNLPALRVSVRRS